jgi:hypothetical protein
MDMGYSARSAAAEGNGDRRLGKTRRGLGFGVHCISHS